MSRGIDTREQHRREERQPLPPALRAELRGRVTALAAERDKIVAEARKQKKAAENEISANYERVRAAAQEAYRRARAIVESEIQQRAEEA